MEEREIFRKLMKKQEEPGEVYDQLRALKIRATYGNAICYQMVRKAAEGDLSAAKYILGLVQEEEAAPSSVDFAEVSTEDLKRMVEGRWRIAGGDSGTGPAGAGQTEL